MPTNQPISQGSQKETDSVEKLQLKGKREGDHFTRLDSGMLQRAKYNPRQLTPVDVTHLQRMIGNRAVERLLRSAAPERFVDTKPVEAESRVSAQRVSFDPSPINLIPQLGYRSPALQMRSQLRAVPLSNPTKLVIQRKVDTWGGEWDTERYTISQSGQRRSADIKLVFKPNDNVDADLIGLTQTLRNIHNNKPFYLNSDPFYKGRAIQSGSAITVNTATKETDEGTTIDRLKPYNNPIYPVDTLPSTSLDDPSTSSGWGQHGYHYKDSKGVLKHQDAILIDAPGIGSVDVSKDSAQILETTALATKGAQAGTYYGSVQWGWRTDSSGNFTKIPLTKVSDGVPSSTFMKSAELWNASKTSTGADTIDLPIVDVKITTAPITGVYPPGFIGPPLQIPAGTRIQIIRNSTASTNGQIKVVDGVFTGNTLEVTPTDMANIRDERP
jgi:hypothetical protein